LSQNGYEQERTEKKRKEKKIKKEKGTKKEKERKKEKEKERTGKEKTKGKEKTGTEKKRKRKGTTGKKRKGKKKGNDERKGKKEKKRTGEISDPHGCFLVVAIEQCPFEGRGGHINQQILSRMKMWGANRMTGRHLLRQILCANFLLHSLRPSS